MVETSQPFARSGALTSLRGKIVLTVLLALFCGGIVVAGRRIYRAQKEEVEAEAAAQLSAIANLKVQQVLAWRRERLAAATFLASNPMLAAPANAGDIVELERWLHQFRDLYGYQDVAVLGPTGRVRIGALDRPADQRLQGLIEAALRSGGPVASDLDRSSEQSAKMDVVAPIRSITGAPPQQVVVLRVDASAFLYAMIQSWPTPSRTAECLLIREENGKVLFLNELRHWKGPSVPAVALSGNSPAAMAARGKEGFLSGMDYRGVAVLAALRQVPETPWSLIAKVDAEEIHASIRQHVEAIAVIVGLLLAVSALTVGFFWNRQRGRFYQQQHQAERRHRILSDRYLRLSRCVNDIVLLLDSEGHVIEANDRAVAAYGYALPELLQMSIRDLLYDSELASFDGRWQHLVENGGQVFEGCHRRKDGSAMPVEVSSRQIREEGRTYTQSIVRDIGERKRTEEHLRRANRAMRVLSASNQAVVRSSDEAQLYRDICEAATGEGGYRLAWIGFAAQDAAKSVAITAASGPAIEYLKDLRLTWGEGVWGSGPVGTSIRTGKKVVTNDIERDAWFQQNCRRVADYECRSLVALPLHLDGKVIGSLAIYAGEADAFHPEELRLLEELAGDLSYGIQSRRARHSQVRAEEAALRAAAELRTVFESTNDAIFITGLDGRHLEVNQAACRSLGYAHDELVSMTIQEMDSPESAAILPLRIAELLERGHACFESVHLRKDGTRVPVELNCRLIDYRQTRAILAVARDIGERKRAEAEVAARTAEMERAWAEAEKANRAKSEFMANMSHEIRTPMNGIIATAGLLLDTPLSADQQDFAETICTSAGALLAIVNEILDFSRIEAGKLTLEQNAFDLVACLAEAGDLLVPQARTKGLEYLFCSQTGERWVTGDAGRIRQIVINLLSNAIKFTDRGTVTLLLESSAAEHGRMSFQISVRDTGMGISVQDLPLLFDKFTQLDSSLGKRHEGTGLGLTISRHLTELMGGSLTVESELGRGSTFTVTLMLPLAAEGAAAELQTVAGAATAGGAALARRVLLAEDNPVNRKIGKLMLEKLGCQVEVALNGREAVEMAGTSPYDLILMDCGMPEMDGLQAARKIRSRQGSRRVPIIALTAHALAGMRKQCLEAGMDDFVTKPVTLETVRQTLRKWSS